MTKTPGHLLVLAGSEDISAPEALNQLAARFPDDTVCLLVPMSAVTVHGPRLPGRHNAAALRGLGWLLEENVATAVNELTLVPLGSEGETVWTAAVDRAWLANWQALFERAGMRLARIVPDALAIPRHDNAPTALKWGDRWLLHTAQWQAAAVEQDWLALWHAAWQRDNPDAPPFYYYGAADAADAALPGWQPLATTEALALLDRTAVNASVSLLPQQTTALRQRARYPTAIAAAIALVLLVLYQGVVNWQSARHTAELAQWLERLPVLPEGVVISRIAYQADKPALQLTLSGSAPARAGVQRLLEKEIAVIAEPDGVLRLTQREAGR